MKTELVNSSKMIQNQQILIYPTDGVWGIGCDATNKVAIAKIFDIKKRSESISFKEISKAILDSVDYIVNLHREAINDKSSAILKVAEKGEILVLRN